MEKYDIMGSYHGRVEKIDTADTEKEAYDLCKEYRMAYGSEWSVWWFENE